MHPTILVCGALYYAAKFYVVRCGQQRMNCTKLTLTLACQDKYQICCQYTKPRIQYGRRARTTTTYIFWSMTIGCIGNLVYYMFLEDPEQNDYVAGVITLLAFVAAATILALYKFQPQKFKALKTSKRAAGKEARSPAAKINSACLHYLDVLPLRVDI